MVKVRKGRSYCGSTNINLTFVKTCQCKKNKKNLSVVYDEIINRWKN